ncbi:MAG: hypothetical protein Q8P81_01235 [Nanoarchaeota archaeon]|nr:hypothetical protein [Nanoarchaeota archaeon]
MIRDKTHSEQIVRWANHVKSSDNWKSELNLFIDAQIAIARRAYDELAKSEDGRLKIKKLMELKRGKVVRSN